MDDRKPTISSLTPHVNTKAAMKSKVVKKRTHSASAIKKNWKIFLAASFVGMAILLWNPFLISLDLLERNMTIRSHIFLKKVGFQVDDLIVEGRSLTSQQDVLKAVNIRRGDSLFASDLKEIKKRLEALSWVRTATIQRRWPFTIYVRLAEYRPIALWQHKAEFYIVDDQGHSFTIPKNNPFQSLPILTGEEAPENAPELFSILKEFPSIIHRMTGALYLGKRRWDLMLDNHLKLKLGEGRIKESLTQFVQMEESHKISDKNIVAIDLRFKDKVYFQLAPEAADVKTSSKQA